MSRFSITSLKSISAGRFDEMLNLLPPVAWQGIGTLAESFRMSEMLDCDTVLMFARLGPPGLSARYFELVAGEGVTHPMAIAHCAAFLQQPGVTA